jgi:hypothetical protein
MQFSTKPRAARVLWSAALWVFATAALPALLPSAVEGQSAPQPGAKIFHACYVPASGTVYRIKEPGSPQSCNSTQHVEFSWTDGVNAIRTGTAAGGDLSGSYPDPTVIKLQGQPVASTRPADQQFLAFDGQSEEWKPVMPTAGGDLSGSLLSPTVIRIQGRPVSSQAPSDGALLQYQSGEWRPFDLRITSERVTIPVSQVSTSSAQVFCPANMEVTGGGVNTFGGDAKVRNSSASGRSWIATVRNDHPFNEAFMTVVVICMNIQ